LPPNHPCSLCLLEQQPLLPQSAVAQASWQSYLCHLARETLTVQNFLQVAQVVVFLTPPVALLQQADAPLSA
jgi:hypothetical protein